MGPSGLGQDDAPQPHRGARSAEQRHRRGRGQAARGAGRGRARQVALEHHRLRLPVVQPAARADGARERRAPPPAHGPRLGRAEEAGADRAARGRARGPDAALPAAALRRSGAARRHRPRHRQRPDDHRGRRAHRRPRSRGADDILALLEKLNTQLGKTILMVTHDPAAAERAKHHPAPRQGKARLMTLTGLAVRNLSRNRFRAALTAVGVAIAIVAFLLLRTVIWAWAVGRRVRREGPRRHAPQGHLRDDASRGATSRTYATRPTSRRRPGRTGSAARTRSTITSSSARSPSTPRRTSRVYDELNVPPEQLDAWKHDRQGAIVGDVLAKKLGLEGRRQDHRSRAASTRATGSSTSTGSTTTTARSVDRSTLLFHWDVPERLAPRRAARQGRLDREPRRRRRARRPTSASPSTSVFDDRDTQTRSQDERSFNASFLAMFSAVLKAMDIMSAVILVIMMLILGNTIAMGVRERTSEYGVLRAIGFLPEPHRPLGRRRSRWSSAPLGGLLGVALAWPFINLVIGRFIEENMGCVLPLLPAGPGEHAPGHRPRGAARRRRGRHPGLARVAAPGRRRRAAGGVTRNR